MGRTAKDLEAYFLAIGRRYRAVDEGTFVLEPPAHGDGPPIGARATTDGPVVFTAELGAAPGGGDTEAEAKFFRRLLEMNASDLLYCAYGVRDGAVILSSAHELSNLDLNEVEAILSDFDLAISRHRREMAPGPHALSA
jgi:hypothetical protein